VEDRFGDNGIIGVMIVQEKDADREIDTFLMS
jgi:predicted enzyme involved in methoxymalonyl-ACP biosynthesis